MVYFARTLWTVKLGKLPVDGTIIKANTSNQHIISKEDLKLVNELIDKVVLADVNRLRKIQAHCHRAQLYLQIMVITGWKNLHYLEERIGRLYTR